MAITIVTPPEVEEGSAAYIRKLFVEFSGRYDLENVDGSDNGAKFFLNAGQRFLDRMLDIDRLRARYTRVVRAGEGLVKIRKARIVQEVYWANASLYERVELQKTTFREYMNFVGKDETLTTRGTVLYYAPAVVRAANTTIDEVAIDASTMDINVGDSDISALRIFPAAEADGVLEVVGLFYSPDLSEDTAKSFWSVHYPEILVQAALYTLEKFMRNSEGMKDQLNALTMDVQQLDFDHVAQQIVNIDQMEG